MIKLKGRTLIITGKDEKIFKQYAKEVKMTPKKFLLEVFKTLAAKYKTIDKDILIEQIK